MDYQRPPWSGYPPTSFPPASHGNGHESMLLGSMLGELKMGQAQMVRALSEQTQALGVQTDVLHKIHGRLEDNARILSERLAAPGHLSPPPTSERMTWRDWAQIVIAAIVVIGAITGRLAPKEAIGLIGKPFGF